MKEHVFHITFSVKLKTETELSDEEIDELVSVLDYEFENEYAEVVKTGVIDAEPVYTNRQVGM